MLYREAGQFKTTYVADQAIFPILQDRIVRAGGASSRPSSSCRCSPRHYLYTEILIPFLILSLAAIGLNILIGYCGQVSLGTGGFMAVGAYAAYNLWLRVPELNNLIVVFLFGGLMAAAVGILFGLPVAAHQGLLSRGRDAGRAVLPRLAVRAREVADQLHAVGLGRASASCSLRLARRHARPSAIC